MRLYVETNFPIGIAKGQDPDAAALLAGAEDTPPVIQVVIPSVCFMEVLSVWESERKQYNIFNEFMTNQIREINRDVISARAGMLVGHLGQSKTEGKTRFDEMEARLHEALFKLTEDADMIALDTEMLRDSLMNDYLDDPTDNLILCCILRHARLDPGGHKAFFSSNHKDFGDPQVCQALEDAGIQYFASLKNAVGWLRSRPARESGE